MMNIVNYLERKPVVKFMNDDLGSEKLMFLLAVQTNSGYSFEKRDLKETKAFKDASIIKMKGNKIITYDKLGALKDTFFIDKDNSIYKKVGSLNKINIINIEKDLDIIESIEDDFVIEEPFVFKPTLPATEEKSFAKKIKHFFHK